MKIRDSSHMKVFIDDDTPSLYNRMSHDWVYMAETLFGISLDPDQCAIVRSVQDNRRTVVRSGHARGKDFVAAVIATCFLYTKCPCKVVLTAPTQRQVQAIMMSEVKSLIRKANIRMRQFGWEMGGNIGACGINFPDLRDDWFLLGFKAEDKSTESWTGFHSNNILVIVTEASGIEDETAQAIEGILTGENARFLLVGNPNRTSGEFFNAFRSGNYSRFRLNCLNAPNVIAKKVIIPGQVDWHWVDDHVKKPGWTSEVSKSYFDKSKGDFEWCGKFYRPSDPFRIKVLGEFPEQPEGSLVPLEWIELAVKRWYEKRETFEPSILSIRYGHVNGHRVVSPPKKPDGSRYKYSLGNDIAGMGADATVHCHRYENFVGELEKYSQQNHMVTAGRIISRLRGAAMNGGGTAFIDSIGEGAGVFSRVEEKVKHDLNPDMERKGFERVDVKSVKFSESAKFLKDTTGQRRFANMRAYCYWCIRDALDPNLEGEMALPPDEDLHYDLTEIQWEIRSDGRIILEPKANFKSRSGRSPDDGDALAVTNYPTWNYEIGSESDTMEGMGIF